MRKKIVSVFLITAITISSVLSAGFSVKGEAKAATAETGSAETEVPVTNVYLGEDHSAALTETGDLYCWGSNTSGEIGNGKTEYSVELPQKTLDHVSSASLGWYHSAAITEDGSLYCWGSNWYQQIGNGSEEEAQAEPVKVLDHVSSVSLGDNHSAAITEDGSLYCWGYNEYGQVGNGTTVNQSTPVKVLENVSSVLLGYESSMALTETGDLYCWGHNHVGQVGNGSEAEIQAEPVKVMENVSSAVTSPDGYHSAALKENGDLYCWGYNNYGQVGNGEINQQQGTPVKVMENVLSVSLGDQHSAAITENGSLYCWGDNQHRQIGSGSEENTQAEPVKVMENAACVSLGGSASAAVDQNGDLYCWGYNNYGQVGNDTTQTQAIPVKVMENVSSVSLGDERSTAITKTGALYSWGFDKHGVVGNGSDADQHTPIKILGSDQCLHRNTEIRGQKAASCKEEGYSGDTYCKDCGEEIERGQVIAATGLHTWDEGTEVKPPTCAENGEKEYICSVCGESRIEEITKTAHTYEEIIIKATTAENGSITEKCTSCGHIKSSIVIFSAVSIDLETSSYTYDGEEKTPAVTVKNSIGEIIDSSNYTVAYKNNREAGKATATAELKGNYTGTLEKTFDILPKEPPVIECTHQNTEVRGQKEASCKEEGYSGDTYCKDCGEEIERGQRIAATGRHTWNEGTEIKSSTCTENGEKKYICSVCDETKIEETPKTPHTYEEIIAKATVSKNGSIVEACSACGRVESTKVIYAVKTLILSDSSYIYDGKAKTPSVTVKDSAGKTIDKCHYTVTYKNNKKIGEATVTVKLKNNYSGTLKKAFEILPKGTSISGRIKAKSRGFQVKWKKQKSTITGFQVQYSTDKKFKKKATVTKTVNKKSASNLTVKKLKPKKTYYVRVRTYQTVNKKDYCSVWSESKKVTTKK
ncbi:MAG: hypothetical protein HFH36_04805 [Lachnospiraceae bacterium]|nr:hypothetical protein [Lachnospiraceae bacterium]